MILNLNTGERLVGEEYCEDTSVWFKLEEINRLQKNIWWMEDNINHMPLTHWIGEYLDKDRERLEELKDSLSKDKLADTTA